MAAAAALTSAPFLRRCGSFLATIRLINNRRRIIHTVANRSPIANGESVSLSPLTSSSTRTKIEPQFMCYCTGIEAEAESATGTAEAEKDTVKEAANTLDIRVGRIIKAWRHEEADSLYVEEVDVGEAEPRTICSGLVKYVPLEQLQERNVVVLANLKARNMRGVKSFGMLMAASDAAHENVELLVPPEGAVPGDRVWFGSIDEKDSLPDAASPNQIQKKKIWEQIQPHLKTDHSGFAILDAKHSMRTSAGPIISQSLKNANIS
ncbi:aminoacyl tRNA synthase complex-interacting multifunctional protein 1 [Salvia hispanica]|uniref:aminoacyl tRNA synthase complex-interacting multifunctional protein 1 n=1 Tax=Salvia hispanica TaxID=49212 RepID=UPI0020098489|nr:aminoacyl tRNA synthase complex-interacting multifunctional protein 1 [Salvia hispanica]